MPKRFSAIIAIIAAAIIVPAVVFAWGPTRDTYTIEKPADKITFNSITNNPNIDDERNFVGIREVGSTNVWYDNMKVQEGKEYFVRMYVHNNAATSLNLVAENVTASVNLPTTTGKSIQVTGYINSSNASPKEVYDHATFTGDKNFNLAYVKSSLKYENNAFGPNGVALPESIFTSAGAKLGYDKLDGKIPGCFQYAGYVTFKVKPQIEKNNDFNLTKMVSKKGADKWVENYNAQPGEEVDFLLSYQNTGSVNQNDVTFRDKLPTGLTYVKDSTYWNNASKKNVEASNNLTTGLGINVGSYAPKANAWTTFTAKVANKEALKCGKNVLTNTGSVTTGGFKKEDTATVTVEKDCPPVKIIKVCELATDKIISIDEKNFDAKKHSKNLADCTKIQVCELATKKIITIRETAFDAKKHSKDLNDCKEKPVDNNFEVCELSSKKIVTIKEADFDATKYSKDLNDCKEDPVVPPVTPPELPQTGAGDIAAIVGLGAMIASIVYYVASRRALGL